MADDIAEAAVRFIVTGPPISVLKSTAPGTSIVSRRGFTDHDEALGYATELASKEGCKVRIWQLTCTVEEYRSVAVSKPE